MATLPLGVRVFLCTQATDMRKSFDGLIAASKTLIGADPLSGHLFVFVNRKANLRHVIERIADQPANRVHELLAWAVADAINPRLLEVA